MLIHHSPVPPVPTRRKPDALLETQETPAATVTALETSQDTQNVQSCVRNGGSEEVSAVDEIETSPGDQKRKIPVGKLDKDAYKPWGTCSRSSSDTGSEGTVSSGGPATCKGGPGNASCGAPVADTDLGVQCDLCCDWFHVKCQLVTKSAFNALEKHINVLSWLCYDCKRSLKQRKDKNCQCSSTEVTSRLEKLDVMQIKIEGISESLLKQEKLIREHGKLLEKAQDDAQKSNITYAEALKGSCAEVVKKVSTKLDTLPSGNSVPPVPTPVTASVATEQVMAGMLQNFIEKDKRKLNLVVYNLPEKSDGDVNVRNMHDVTTFVDIVKDCLGLDVHVSKSYRAGRMTSERPRTLVLTLDNLEKKIEILENAYKLSRSSKWKRVYIAPDRTLKEREEHKKLRDELKKRKEDGEENIFIHKGKIIQKTRPATVEEGVPQAATSAVDLEGPTLVSTEVRNMSSAAQMEGAEDNRTIRGTASSTQDQQ